MVWCNRIKIRNKKYAAFFGAVIGAVTFFIVYGMRPLHVTDDTWIMQGYDEMDILARYAGWVNFRNAQWQIPLGKIDLMAFPCGMMISYLDAIPWVAVFFKLFDPILPQTFQFEGIYMFVSFSLQGMAAALLLYKKSARFLSIGIGVLFFTFSPILLERGFRHSALASHFLILFSMYLWMEGKEQLYEAGRIRWKYLTGFVMLNVISVGITPYFMPMVMCFLFLSLADFLKKTKRYLYAAFVFVINCLAVIASAYLLGVLGGGIHASRWGYGHFSMNLNAIVNPRSLGGYAWSRMLKEQEQLYGQYDGFNYLGLGILLLLLLFVLIQIQRPLTQLLRNIKQECRENILVIFVCFCMAAFAVSNVVCFGTYEMHVPLPENLLELCGIFRASSRIFWPVWYLIVFGVVSWFMEKAGIRILVVMCIIQIADMSGMVIQKHHYFAQAGTDFEFPDIYDAMSEEKELICVSGNGTISAWYFGVMCGKKHMTTNLVYAGSGDYEPAYAYGMEASLLLDKGRCQANKIYMTDNADQYQNWKQIYSESECEDYKCEFGGITYYFLATGNRDMQRLVCTNLTDQYWENGVSKYSETLLFAYSDELLELLKKSEVIKTDQGVMAKITAVTNDDVWIHVSVDGNKEAFAFPHKIQLQSCG